MWRHPDTTTWRFFVFIDSFDCLKRNYYSLRGLALIYRVFKTKSILCSINVFLVVYFRGEISFSIFKESICVFLGGKTFLFYVIGSFIQYYSFRTPWTLSQVPLTSLIRWLFCVWRGSCLQDVILWNNLLYRYNRAYPPFYLSNSVTP